MEKIVITGGHLTPALALIDELKKKKDIDSHFFGRKYATEGSKSLSVEYTTLQKAGIKFYAISAGRIQRKFTKYTVPSFIRIPVGFVQSFFYLLKIRPKLIISFGGYLSFPAIFTGWLLGIKSITHEQSVEPGLATKLNSLFVEKIYLAWDDNRKLLPQEKSKVIGNLVGRGVFKKGADDKKLDVFLKNVKKLIVVLGGNQGSHFINNLIFELLPKLSNYQTLHQVGIANFQGDLDAAKKINRKNYLAIDYINQDDIGAVLNRADLVISRSGANTVWDLAILGKVAIFIPLPIAAGNEQFKNAQILEKAGSAIIINQEDLNQEILKQKIDYVFKNLSNFEKNASAFARTLPKNATKILTSEILKMLYT